MTRSATDALTWARGKVGTTGYGGMCLAFVRTAFDVPAKYASARAAWAGASRRHETSSLSGIPVGAPVWMDHPKSVYGHVVIHAGGGQIITTNSATNRIHLHNLSVWQGWGYTVLGWAEDINGQTIPGLTGTTTTTDTTTATGTVADQEDPMIFVQDNAGNYYLLTPASTQAKHLTPTQWSAWVKAGASLRNPGAAASAGLTREAIGDMAATLGGAA